MNIWGTDGPLASLPDILDRRERRVQSQRELLGEGPCLVSFCMNIPGARKSFPLADAGFQEGLRQIRQTLADIPVLRFVRSGGITGEEAFLLVDDDPRAVKARMIGLEEAHPLGRLWDIDVLDSRGTGLSRRDFGHARRTCLICSQDAKICGRSRAHTIEQLFQRTAQILDDYFQAQAAKTAADCVARAMLDEVSATPKPGLVDRENNGSHRDMDFNTFLRSIRALQPFFEDFFTLGWQQYDTPDEDLFAALRSAGVQAEQAMFAATGGVNTHKGMVFSAAILCGALGRLHAGISPIGLDHLRRECARLGRCALSDFEADAAATAGLRCYRQLQVAGIRGEAAAGFPSAVEIALPALLAWKGRDVSPNDRALYALMHLIAHVDDTNMIHRGGREAALTRKAQALALLPELTPENILSRLTELDAAYIAENLSPGGCADLLSLAVALEHLREAELIAP